MDAPLKGDQSGFVLDRHPLEIDSGNLAPPQGQFARPIAHLVQESRTTPILKEQVALANPQGPCAVAQNGARPLAMGRLEPGQVELPFG